MQVKELMWEPHHPSVPRTQGPAKEVAVLTCGFLAHVLEDHPMEREADRLTQTISHPKSSFALRRKRLTLNLLEQIIWRRSCQTSLKEPNSDCLGRCGP